MNSHDTTAQLIRDDSSWWRIPERQTYDYLRHGTTTLFAALEVATGKVDRPEATQSRAHQLGAAPTSQSCRDSTRMARGPDSIGV